MFKCIEFNRWFSCKRIVIQYTHCDGCHNPSAHSMRCAVEKRRSVIAVFFILSWNTEYASYIANNHFITAQHKMIVLSLFDWISCARVALQRAWIKVHAYYASEIDKYAIKVSQKNRDDVYHIGNVKDVSWMFWRLKTPRWYWQINAEPKQEDSLWISKIDLLIWWSPCQDLSIAKKDRKWLDGERSWLFREYVRILKETKPKRFILENVASMPKEAKDIITAELWVEPIMIDAALVSAQSRKRLFRTNIPGVTIPEDKWILLKDIIEDWNTTDLKSYCITANYQKMTKQNYEKWQWQMIRVWHFNSWWQGDRIYSDEWKSVCLSALWWWRGAKTWLYAIKQKWRWFNKWWIHEEKSPTLTANRQEMNNHLVGDDIIRKLTPIECERLQCLPDEYTSWISNSQRYKCLWNAFNVDVVAHILSFIPKK